jgi:response regulator RpfG family c-di-GMP phosphodiesterase
MSDKRVKSILFVDDDQNLLDGLSRQLRKSYSMTTACGPHEALARIDAGATFAVVVSDYTMPRMTGIEFLTQVAGRLPDAVRVLLTGNADLELALEAVNRGGIFRLLVKPCDSEKMRAALDASLEQFRLREAERVLLEQTLGGCVQLVADVVSHMSPDAFGRALRLRGYTRELAARLKLEAAWRVETAALLSQLGIVALPPDLLARASRRNQLSPEERRVYEAHPRVARKLLARIPRLEVVADIIGRQAPPEASEKPWSAESALAAQLLRAATAFDDLIVAGKSVDDATRAVAALLDLPEEVGRAAAFLRPPAMGSVSALVPVQRLAPGMVLEQDLRRQDGQLVIARGHEITPSLLERLMNYVNLGQLSGNVQVRTPGDPNAAPPAAVDDSLLSIATGVRQ